MDSLTILFAVSVVVTALLGAIAIRAPRQLAIRSGAVVLAGLLMATAYAAYAELMGRPKPISLEWAARNATEATVVAADMREGEAIYLWLQLDEAPAPRAYALPWSLEAARELHQAQGEAAEEGTEVRMSGPFQETEEGGERMFYAEPQKPLPPKLTRARGLQ